MLKEFREFAIKGNAIDLAVAVIIGAAFGKIVTSIVEDLVMPIFGLIFGRVNFADMYWNLTNDQHPALAEAKKLGYATINYGQFLNNVINFLIIAFAIFLVVKQLNRFKKEPIAVEEVKTPTREEELLTEIRDALRSK